MEGGVWLGWINRGEKEMGKQMNDIDNSEKYMLKRALERIDHALACSNAGKAHRICKDALGGPGKTPCPDGGKCHKQGETCGDPICVEWHADLLNAAPKRGEAPEDILREAIEYKLDSASKRGG